MPFRCIQYMYTCCDGTFYPPRKPKLHNTASSIKINFTFSDLDLKFAVQNKVYKIVAHTQTFSMSSPASQPFSPFSSRLCIFSICLCNASYRSSSFSFVSFFVRFLCHWLLSPKILFSVVVVIVFFVVWFWFGSWRFTEMDKKVLIANKPNYFSSFWLLTIFIWYEWVNLRIELEKCERCAIRHKRKSGQCKELEWWQRWRWRWWWQRWRAHK